MIDDNLFEEKLRREQTSPEPISMVNQIKERLSYKYDVRESNKYFYQLTISYAGTKIADYWCKQDYPRLVIPKKVLSKCQCSFDLSKRTAFKESKGQIKEFTNEFVLTPEEAELVLAELAEQVVSAI